MMSFATDPDAASPPGPAPSETTMTTYGAPSHSDLAAVAATVSVVGVLMALLITWLVLRLRHAQSTSTSTPLAARCSTSNASYIFRPSFAPSETSSKFGFARKPLHLSHRRQDGSWDFADPDPSKEGLVEPIRTPSYKHRPAPLLPMPAYIPRAHRASSHKDEPSPRTPTTPASMGYVDSPPPVYCRESTSWPNSLS